MSCSAEQRTDCRPGSAGASPSRRFTLDEGRGWLRWIVAFGVLVRVRQYAANTSLWHDESFVALNIRNTPFTALLGPLDWHEPSPPGFLALQQLIVAAVGDSEYALRLLPLLAGVAALFAFVAFARRIGCDDTTIVWATMFMAFSPKLIEQASQVKHFTFDGLTTVALLTLVWRAWQTGSRRMLLAWALVAALSPWFSYASVFVVAATSAMIALRAYTRWSPLSRRTFLFGNVSVLLSLMLLLVPVQQQRTGAVLAFWGRAFPNVADPLDALAWLARSGFAFLGHYWQPMNAVMTVCVLLACAAAWANGRRAQLALCWLPVLLTVLAAFLHLWPFGGNQHAAFLAPIVLLVAAQGAEIVRSSVAPWRPRLAVAFMTLLLAPGVGDALYHLIVPRYRHELRPVIRYMQVHAAPNDALIVFDPATFAYYTGRDLRGDRVDTTTPARVWVITPRARSGAIEPDVEGVLTSLRQRRAELDRVEVHGAAAYLFAPLERSARRPCRRRSLACADRTDEVRSAG